MMMLLSLVGKNKKSGKPAMDFPLLWTVDDAYLWICLSPGADTDARRTTNKPVATTGAQTDEARAAAFRHRFRPPFDELSVL